MGVTDREARSLGLTTLVLVVLAIASTSAHAATNHVAGAGFDLPGEAGAPSSIAIDETSGSVYAMSGGIIEKFDTAGNPSNFSATGTNTVQGCAEGNGWGCYQVAVDNSGGPNQGVIYVSDLTPYPFGGQGVRTFLPSGQQVVKNVITMSEEGTSTAPCGVAVDDSGDLIISYADWTGASSIGFVDRLEPPEWSSEPEAKPTVVGEYGADFSYSCRVQVDSTGSTYQLGANGIGGSGPVRKIAPSPFGAPNVAGGGIPPSLVRESASIDAGPVHDLALDAEDNLYVTRGARVLKYDPAGTAVESIEGGQLQEPEAIAVNRGTGVIYVSDRGSGAGAQDVRTYTPVNVTDSLTGGFDAATQTSGTLEGEAAPAGAGPISACDFQFTPTSTYGEKEFAEATTLPCDQSTPIATDTAVSAPVAGLTLERPYVFRLRTVGPNGTSNGTVKGFTPHNVIGLSTDAATAVAPRSATLNASFLGNSDQTQYSFEYGINRAYGTKSAPQTLPAPSGPTTVSLPISGLELETTYHYRVVATNGTGSSKAEDRTFTTPPAVAGLVTKPVGTISQEGITLNGEFIGNGLPTHYYFEYGLDKGYGELSEPLPGSDAGQMTGPTPVSSTIGSFEGYRTYHYRVVAVNDLGTSYGKDQSFRSPDALAPAIQGTASSGIGPTAATLSAEVNPNRWTTSYLFEWGRDTNYGTSTSLKNTIAGDGDDFHPVSALIGELEPGTLYHYRVVALNLTGTTKGPDLTFTTPAPPGVEPGAASSVTTTSAHLSAQVVPNASPTAVRFEFGPSAAYGASTAPTAIGSSTISTTAAADLNGLVPGATYHFRVVAENAFGNVTGPDVSFTTVANPAAAPIEKKGNAPLKCAKPKVKRKGHCVKKKPAKKKHGGKKKGGRANG